ncbi:MAG: hypothetical protein VSS75_033715 [Candidatus Parabeggiatoa sp.]|nr:hypothetical protein [Candidatus Parabeggiatoa sp.]
MSKMIVDKIILLPGMDGTGIFFGSLQKNLAEKVTTEIISYPTSQFLSYKQLLEYVIEKLPRGESTLLVAESFSGPIAKELAFNNLINLKGIVFLASFICCPRKLLKIIPYLPVQILFRLPIPDIISKLILLGKDANHESIAQFRQVLKLVPPSILTQRLEEIAKHKCSKGKSNCPCWYIQASNDKLVLASAIKPIKSAFPKTEVVVIDGPHFVAQAEPEKCAKHIIACINA